MNTPKAWTAILAVVVATTASLVAGSATPASAQCQGGGSEWTWGPSWGWESVQVGVNTCNGDDGYSGRVSDRVNDGNCVDIYRRDDAPDPWVFTARECTTGAWENFAYNYADGDSQFKLCKHIAGTCSSVANNWGF